MTDPSVGQSEARGIIVRKQKVGAFYAERGTHLREYLLTADEFRVLCAAFGVPPVPPLAREVEHTPRGPTDG